MAYIIFFWGKATRGNHKVHINLRKMLAYVCALFRFSHMHALWLNILTEALPLSFFLQKEGSPSVARRLCPVYVPRRLRPAHHGGTIGGKIAC